MKNKFILIWFFSLFLIFLFLFFILNNTEENKIDFNNQEIIIVQESTKLQNQINNTLDSYSWSLNLLEKYSLIKEINNQEILDFYLEYDFKSTSDDLKVEFVFANNKLTFLVNSIFESDENSLNKVLFLSYLKSYFWKNNINISHFIDKNIDYLEVFDIDKIEYSKENIIKNIKKYFVLENLKKNNHFKDTDFLNDIYWDFLINFSSFSNLEKLTLFFYLSYNWELNKFLNDLDLEFDDIFNKSKLNDYEKWLYFYILSKNKKIDSIDDFSDFLVNYENYDEKTLILIIASLNLLSLDFSAYYRIIENIPNFELDLETKFLKFLIFKDLKNEYNSYSNYSRFWYSAWLLWNRMKEFDLIRQRPYYREEHDLERLIYNDEIDVRVVSFRWDKFYLNVIIKQK